jgi:dipeptidyl aminopeptidase/acylaminoacyl peptidase
MKHLLLVFIFSIICLSCSSTKSGRHEIANKETFMQMFLSHPTDNKNIEYFIDKPKSEKPLKTIILVHGHQFPEKVGGYDFVKWGVLDKWKNRGYLAVAISQPGYGSSNGKPDYCGLYTQDAVVAVKTELIKKKLADPNDITLLGISRGAMVSGMVAAREKDIKNLVLIAGAYDLEALYNKLEDSPLKRNIRNEGGAKPFHFRERSVLSHAEKIKSKTLILHGKEDRQPTFQNAKDLFSLLKISNGKVKFHAFDSGHRTPIKERNKIIDNFLLYNH